MAYDNEHKTAAELEREIQAQRSQVESRIDEIQERLSPGQLVDELLSYGKNHGGGDFVANLGRSATSNPLPIALVGIGLAWLMAKPGSDAKTSIGKGDQAWNDSINARRGYNARSDYDDTYPVTTINGSSLQRLGRVSDHGHSYSEFADDAGKKFRALTDETGKRAGHFVDEAGNTFSGFTDSAGEQVKNFRDEAGNLLDEATGWAAHNWQKVQEKLHDARDAVGSGRDQAGLQADQLTQTVLTQFRDQPLVGGALAFAIGAALGSALPHTPQEDALMGEAADAVKAKAGTQAADLYAQGKEQVADLYDKASEKAGDLYHEAKDGLVSAVDDNTEGGGTGPSGFTQ
ncbi:ElaB/YqjD/DUF883 family membrane-anchored ribosome-binding protein [Devosia sp. UYZn731]|uniref:DUF3618 domain-containing protein n=1 Tax=Devosia sp. UYZn731 TaxID=3156345 RepID=UPI003393E916